MDDDARLTPLQMVAREMERHTDLTRGQIETAIESVLDHLKGRALRPLKSDQERLERALQYQAVSEVILFLGTQLIAFEDIEEDDDPEDVRNLRN